MHKLTKERWVAVDGSILTEKTHKTRADYNTRIELIAPKAIAFNVGQELAEYIVRLHNERVALRQEIVDSPDKQTDN